MKIRASLFCCASLVAACSTSFESAPLASSNPASAHAEEAPFVRPKRIAVTGVTARATSSVVEASTEEGAVYVCPMHPEVQSDKPGQCPKCGMALLNK